MSIKLRYYCPHCLERSEAEIIYDTDGMMFCKSTKQRVLAKSEFILVLDGPLYCPNKGCGREIPEYKIIRDRPERYIGKDGYMHLREYKNINDE